MTIPAEVCLKLWVFGPSEVGNIGDSRVLLGKADGSMVEGRAPGRVLLMQAKTRKNLLLGSFFDFLKMFLDGF